MASVLGQENPLHLVVIDSWVPAAVEAELAAGRLPALAFLLQHGSIDYQCTTTFPSVTPACLAALATGAGPDRNHITGVLWYDRLPDRYVHYWPYPQSVVWGTLSHVVGDFFLRLNRQHLSSSVQTIFECLESQGRVAASVNFPVSRGLTLHRAVVPWLLERWGGLPREMAMSGPRYLRFGDMVPGRPAGWGRFFKKYGFNDATSAAHSVDLIQSVRPDFMLTYFNENDLRTHHHGPAGIGWSLQRVDRELGRLMSAYGSWAEAVAQARWILVGDHSQSETHPFARGHAVNVFKAFPGYRVAPLREGGLRSNGHDFAVGPNDRMCYFYFPEEASDCREKIRALLATWPSVDQILWREGAWFWAEQAGSGRTLSWQPGGSVHDVWDNAWHVVGDPGVFDARVEQGRWLEGAYPNALARASAALSVPRGSALIITAKLGYEFTSGFPMGRGNHGSLHRLDSWVPLVTVGVPAWPRPRLTDVYAAVARALGVNPEGAPTTPVGLTG